jgi:hypothetical protein
VRLLWNILDYAFSFNNFPDSVQSLFSVWLPAFRKQEKILATLGGTPLFWTIYQMQHVLRKKWVIDSFAVIHRVGYWLYMWRIMQSKQVNNEDVK